MSELARSGQGPLPALRRLASLAPLSPDTQTALTCAIKGAQRHPVRSELLSAGVTINEPRLIVSGWAARVSILGDGRRQFLSFLLPGDLIGMCRHPHPVAISSVVALTELRSCVPPRSGAFPDLADAFAMSQALEEAYLLAHIARLGSMNAQERIADLLLELHERLSLAGLTRDGRFDIPLTQEMLGDALGLTSVHINRMLQLARREEDILWHAGYVTLPSREALARKIGRSPIVVSSISSRGNSRMVNRGGN